MSGGCCVLAGSWGFEKGKYRISMDCGEQALLPAVRNASKDTLIVANGFSCKTQIEQAGTGRHPLHLGQVIQLARQQADGTSHAAGRNVRSRPHPPAAKRATRLAASGGIAAAAALAGRAALHQSRRRGA